MRKLRNLTKKIILGALVLCSACLPDPTIEKPYFPSPSTPIFDLLAREGSAPPSPISCEDLNVELKLPLSLYLSNVNEDLLEPQIITCTTALFTYLPESLQCELTCDGNTTGYGLFVLSDTTHFEELTQTQEIRVFVSTDEDPQVVSRRRYDIYQERRKTK